MAGKPSRFVSNLSQADIEALTYLRDHGEKARIRHRAHAILLSHGGKSIDEIAEIFETTRVTVTAWLDRWEESGPAGLGDAPRSGAPPTLTPDEKCKVVELLKEHPHSPKQVLHKIPEVIGKTISASTLRRIARESGLRWKRMRKSAADKQDPLEFKHAKQELELIIGSHEAGELDLYYFDEARFSLDPTVPYGWQPVGETIGIPTARGGGINALGFLSYDSDLVSYTIPGTIDAECVISCMDDFSQSINRLTVVVIDNASPHTCKKFAERVAEWEKRGLVLYYLPPYCPELNLIEILWRMIKHHWLPLEAYKSFDNLVKCVHDVLANVGTRYTIEFA